MIKFLLCGILISNGLFSFEKMNHEAIARTAISNCANLDRFINSLQSHGNPGKFIGLLTTTEIRTLIAMGASDEDGWRPIGAPPGSTVLRAGNHFLDPIYKVALSDPCWEQDIYVWSTAQDWALSTLGPFENLYSLPEMKDYLFRALTGHRKLERNYYINEYFKSIGHIIHLLQDMSVPAHTRNDSHMPTCFRWDCPWSLDPEIDRFEAYCERKVEELPYVGYSNPVLFDHLADYWSSISSKGLADFTNANFVSQDTNIDHYSRSCRQPFYYSFPWPKGILEIDEQVEEYDVHFAYLHSTVHDNYLGEEFGIDHLSAVSFWNQLNVAMNPVYLLDDNCFADYANFLVPRATAYSRGLINMLYKGRIEVKLDKSEDLGSIMLKLKNLSDDNYSLHNGSVTIVAHYSNDPQTDLDDEWLTLGEYYLDSLINANLDRSAYWSQEFSYSSLEGVSDLTAIYRGGG